MRPQVERRISPEEIIANAEQYQREALHRYYRAEYHRIERKRALKHWLLFLAAVGVIILLVRWIQ